MLADSNRANGSAELALAHRCVTERGAREEVYRRYAPMVYGLTLRITGNQPDAEDILQEVFIEVFHSIQNFRGEAPLASWIKRITVRTAFRHIRKHPPPFPLESVQHPVATGPDPLQVTSDRALARRLYQLLEKLKEKVRVVFILHVVEGHSIPETAALLGISVTAAKKRVWRARQLLEKYGRQEPLLLQLVDRGGPC